MEFESKRVAKSICSILNNSIIHGKRKHAWYGETWNIKYMKGVKWNDLQGKISMERKIQESKIRMAISESKKKVDKFSKDISREKMLQKLEAKGKLVQRPERHKTAVKLTRPWKEKVHAQADNFLAGLLTKGMT